VRHRLHYRHALTAWPLASVPEDQRAEIDASTQLCVVNGRRIGERSVRHAASGIVFDEIRGGNKAAAAWR